MLAYDAHNKEIFTQSSTFCRSGFWYWLCAKDARDDRDLGRHNLLFLYAAVSLVLLPGVNAILFLIGIWLCQYTADNMGTHDHPAIVWDEVVGYLITMVLASPGWLWMLIGFVLFRFFDILKPWPIAWLDKRVKGGLGIMLDDVVAGFFGLAVIQVLIYFF